MNKPRPKPWLKPAILQESPILDVFDRTPKHDYNLIILFALAYYNRTARKAAIAIERNLGLPNSINSQGVRYLLLLYFAIQTKQTPDKTIRTSMLERSDLYKRDRTRLTSMLRLHEVGLVVFRKKSDTVNTLELTELGYKAINVVIQCINELIHTQPRNGERVLVSKISIKMPHA
jgi:hypothetical protein